LNDSSDSCQKESLPPCKKRKQKTVRHLKTLNERVKKGF